MSLAFKITDTRKGLKRSRFCNKVICFQVISVANSVISVMFSFKTHGQFSFQKHRNSLILTKRQSCFHKYWELFMYALVIQRTVPDFVFKLVSTLRQSTMASISQDTQQQRIILRKENNNLVLITLTTS